MADLTYTPEAESRLGRAARAVASAVARAPLFFAAVAIVEIHVLVVGLPVVALLVLASAAAYVWLPQTLRAAVAGVIAAIAAFGAVLHGLNVSWNGVRASDLTGLALAAAAVLFSVVAIRALLARRRVRLWLRVVRFGVTAVAAVLLAFLVVTPVVSAMWLAGKPREPLSPATLPIPYSDVTLHASDGVRLSGWYVPSRNGAAVVLVHGGGGDRNGVRRQALLLARHGFGVLLYDERGRGRSGGTPQAMGWNWVPDVEAAVDYLERRPGVRRVGVLGLSTGAEVAVTAAAHDARIDAVVAEGLISRSLDDTRQLGTSDQISGIPYWWVAFHALELETGTHPPEPLTEALRAVAPRPLLIIAAAENPPERAVAPVYVRAAGPTAGYWLAQSGHTQAFESFPRLYEQRVVGLFERALVQR